ncbi:hypothetical protein SLEP1_g51907 [Rubroshorea leprosula]|uniref:Uncharacterized protein n=1 Tax=Rubroshorea leprosula TaxID=152421 RepID=A0AAV5M793_9ROSI|nr:hypothetical protein SLEP1_g51907 [Rubroshorea leprosula]
MEEQCESQTQPHQQCYDIILLLQIQLNMKFQWVLRALESIRSNDWTLVEEVNLVSDTLFFWGKILVDGEGGSPIREKNRAKSLGLCKDTVSDEFSFEFSTKNDSLEDMLLKSTKSTMLFSECIIEPVISVDSSTRRIRDTLQVTCKTMRESYHIVIQLKLLSRN